MLDTTILKNFHNQVDKLRLHKNFFQNLSVSFSFKDNQGIVKSQEPDNSTVKAFLVDFRPFILTDCNFNFGRICNSIFKDKDNFKNQEIVNNTQKARDEWNKLLGRKGKKTGIGLTLNNKVISNEENLLLWINEEYFHPDERNQLNHITSNPLFGSMSRHSFLYIVQRLSGWLFWFNKQVAQKIINDYE